MSSGSSATAQMDSKVYTPTPPSEWGQWLLALAVFLLGVAVLVAVLSGAVGFSTAHAAAADPPAVLVDAVTPTAVSGSQVSRSSGRGPVVGPYAGVTGGRGGSIASGGRARAVASVGVFGG